MKTKKVIGVTGVLLAGGQSKRMGVDKRLLEVGGQPLFVRVLEVLEGLFEEVVISVARLSEDLPVGRHRVVPDLIPGMATLGGLYSSLKAVTSEWIFAVACDMPLVNPELVRYLVGVRDGHDFVVPVLSTGPQPMHACYRNTCLPVLEDQIHRGDLKLHGLLQEPALRGFCVPEGDLLPFDPHLHSFLNVNTPADLEMVRKLITRSANRSQLKG